MQNFSLLRNWTTTNILTLAVFTILAAGCSDAGSRPYDRALVSTYAELTMLYEKEKMTNTAADSLYQTKVKEFFRSKGYDIDTFKSVIDELSQNPAAWKMFLQDVTTAMDSLRSAQH